MEILSSLLDTVLLGETVRTWLVAACVVVGGTLALRVIATWTTRLVSRLAARTENVWDDALAAALAHTHLFFLAALSLRATELVVRYTASTEAILDAILALAVIAQVGLWADRTLRGRIDSYAAARAESDPGAITGLGLVAVMGSVVIWAVAVLVALANLGVDVTALVAGLGITGIAVGLALQNVLGDIFASISIVLDKPFKVGDFIIVGDEMGNVERVGLKTTRVRSLGGEQLVFSNGDLLKSRIRNYKRMEERRIVFRFGVTYETPADQLAHIPEMVREIVESIDGVRFDRAHFAGYGDFSLDFEVVYYVLTADYARYMDLQQLINLRLYAAMETMGVDFAYPTRTLYVRRDREHDVRPRPTSAIATPFQTH